MFWDSVIGGFGLLLSWRIWVGLSLYLLANSITLVVTGTLFSKEKTAGVGCLFAMLIRPALGAIFMSLFVVSLFPVMLGAKEAMGPDSILVFLWPISKAGLAAFVTVGILCLVPVLGAFIADSLTLQTFLQGLVVFRIFSGSLLQGLSNTDRTISSSVYPGVWESLGYLVLAGILARVTLMASALFGTLARNTR